MNNLKEKLGADVTIPLDSKPKSIFDSLKSINMYNERNYKNDMYSEGITLAADWCECGHHLNSHGGHTHVVGTPEPVHCACCTCKEFKTKEVK